MRTRNVLAAALTTVALASLTACGSSGSGGPEAGADKGAPASSPAPTSDAPAGQSLADLMNQKGYESGALFLKMSDDELNSVTADDKQICTMMSGSQDEGENDNKVLDKKMSLFLARLEAQASDPSIKTVLGSLSSALTAKPKDRIGMAFALMGEWPAMSSACRTLGVKVQPLKMS